METIKSEFQIKSMLLSSFDTWSSDEESTSTYSDSDSTTSEENVQPAPVKLAKVRRFVEDTVDKYTDEEFKHHFRMSRITVKTMINMLKNSNILPSHSDRREKISARKSFLLALWYFSNIETFREVANLFDVSYSSAHRCLRRVIKFLLLLQPHVIKWPTDERLETIITGFKKKDNMGNILGVIDGSHIEIPRPKYDQDAYCNRKGYHSIILQGIVDHEKRFLNVFCGEAGSMHDARVLRKSGIYTKMQENPQFMGNCFLLGDSAYPTLHWIKTPYKDNGHLTIEQKTYNQRLSSKRVIIENAFGLLKGRFRRLRKLDNIDISLSTKLIMSACVLHNICINENDFIETETNDFNQPP